MEQIVASSNVSARRGVEGSPLPLDRGIFPPGRPIGRLSGVFYTPNSAADYMADWVVRHDGERVLEPSFGDGIFLRAVTRNAERKGFTAVRLTGVEIDKEVSARAVCTGLLTNEDVWCQDFLNVSPFKVQAVIGNPPYVRLRHLPKDQRANALGAAEVAMRFPMDPSGSLWMPFLLHAMRFLEVGGRLAFILPYDLTYVRYARPLWQKLRASFGSLDVLRSRERLFPDLLQDVVILLADTYGSCTDTVRYQAFERVDDLINMRPAIRESLHVDNILGGERAFLAALLDTEVRCLLSSRVANATVPAREVATFNIGYVAGDKRFFHPAEEDVELHQIPTSSLRPTLTATRPLRGAGLRTSSLGATQTDRLFLPNPKVLTAGDQRYIALGVARQIPSRYKCRIRKPWYVVPGIRVPDIVLSVFSERPVMLINDIGCLASNSLLCGYRKTATGEEIITGWYTSLTLLQCELEIHALGGGVMVLVPREAGNIRLPKPNRVRAEDAHLANLDRLLRLGKLQDAYRAGDSEILVGQLGFSDHDVELIRRGAEVLAHWRTSARSSRR